MDYWKLVKRAWKITAKYKFLWIFGLFLGGVTFSGGSSFNNNYSSQYSSSQNIDILDKGKEIFFANIIFISIISIIVLVIFLVITSLQSLASGSVIAGVNEIEISHKSSFASSFKLGLQYFWKILAVQLLSALLYLSVFLILSLPVITLFVLEMYLRGFILGVLAFAILLPLIAIIKFTKIYALRVIVVEKVKIIQALRKGFYIFKDNLSQTLIITVIIFAINTSITIIVLIALLFLGILFGIPAIIMSSIVNIGAGIIGGILLVILGILIFGILFVFIGAIINTFKSGLWTLVYRELK